MTRAAVEHLQRPQLLTRLYAPSQGSMLVVLPDPQVSRGRADT